MRFRSVLLLGSPGSGKGTQGRILGAIPNFFHFAAGDAFRNLRLTDPIARVFLDYSGRGELVPDEATIDLFMRQIEAAAVDGRFKGDTDMLVLDGIPRNLKQARLLAERIDVRRVIHLACPDLTKMIERMQRRALVENRLDDANVEVIRRRLATYERETRPVRDFYGPSLVRRVDALQPPAVVLHQILDEIVGV